MILLISPLSDKKIESPMPGQALLGLRNSWNQRVRGGKTPLTGAAHFPAPVHTVARGPHTRAVHLTPMAMVEVSRYRYSLALPETSINPGHLGHPWSGFRAKRPPLTVSVKGCFRRGSAGPIAKPFTQSQDPQDCISFLAFPGASVSNHSKQFLGQRGRIPEIRHFLRL